jgi:hypothetical protein
VRDARVRTASGSCVPDPRVGCRADPRASTPGDATSRAVVVGAPVHTVGAFTNQGEANVFVRPNTGWSNAVENTILRPLAGAAGDSFGNAIAISGDTVVVGARARKVNLNTAQGEAYVFVKPNSGWPTAVVLNQNARLFRWRRLNF